jgi:hypothetical protein
MLHTSMTSSVTLASALKEPNVMKPFMEQGAGATGGGSCMGA